MAETLAGTDTDSTFLVENEGLRFEGSLNSFIDRQIYLFGGYEEPRIKAFLDFIPRHRRDVALDVGANVGTHALRFAQHFCEVHAFEPNPNVFRQLKRNAELNRLPVTLHPVGLADREGMLDFHLTRHANNGLGTFSKNEQYDVPLSLLGQAKVVKADFYLQLTGRIDAVKIDTQGFEGEVLKGMRDLLREHQPFVWFELGTSTLSQLASRKELEDLIPFRFRLFRFLTKNSFKRTTKLVEVCQDTLLTGDYVVKPLRD